MAKLLHIFYHKEGTFSLLCQQVQLFTHSLKYFSKIKTDYPASSNLYTLTYYKSENRSSLYTSVFSISSKFSFTVTTSSLYVIPYQVSLLRNTLTDILFSANNSPIKVGIRYSAFIGSAGTSFLKKSTNPAIQDLPLFSRYS